MRTNRTETHCCEYCGVNFTNRTYAERIGHSNMTSNFDVKVNRFNDTKNNAELFDEMLDAIDLERYNENPRLDDFKNYTEKLNCLIGALRNGILIYDYKQDEYTTNYYPKIADFFESKRKSLKAEYNKVINQKLDKKRKNFESEISYLKRSLVK